METGSGSELLDLDLSRALALSLSLNHSLSLDLGPCTRYFILHSSTLSLSLSSSWHVVLITEFAANFKQKVQSQRHVGECDMP